MKLPEFFTPRLFRRLLIYFLGSYVLALGVSIAAKTNLGVTPMNSIAYVASRIFIIDHGLLTAIICGCYVLFQAALEGRQFRPVSLLQIAVAMIFGWLVFLNNNLLSFFTMPDIYWVRLLCMMGSVVFIGLGIILYLRADLIPHPADGLLLAIQKKTGWKQQNAKIFLDGTMTATAIVFSLITTGGIVGIREGTFIAVVGLGKTMGLFSKHLGTKIDTLFKLNESTTPP